jgi:hypothetical protein
VDERVVSDVVDPVLVLRLRRQLAEQRQVGRLQEVALLSDLLDGDAPVTQDPLLPVDDAVFLNAGSYDNSPKSASDVLIPRRFGAGVAEPYSGYVPCSTGTSYSLPVRWSIMVSVSGIVSTS